MKNRMSFFVLVAVVSIAAWGCGTANDVAVTADSDHGHDHSEHDGDDHDQDDHDQSEHDQHIHDGDGATVEVAVMYCGDCGFAKGSEKCCEEGAEVHSCGLLKGSPLCCKLEGDFAGKALCGACGEAAAEGHQCSADAQRCASCNLIKGSPLCCKLGDDKLDDDAAGDDEQPAAADDGAES